MRLLAASLLCLAGCAASQDSQDSQDPQVPQGASPAADALIERAATPEEREELAAVRDQVDAEKRAEAAALDAEIERLEKENAKLRARR